MHATCGRSDCGLTPNDRFCMVCGKAAADVAETTSVTVEAAPIDVDAPLAAALADFATGATEQNAVYIGNRLMYERNVEEMDPVRSPQVFLHLILQLILFVAVPSLLAVGLGFAAVVLAVLNAIADNPLTSGLGSLARILAILAALGAVVAFFVGLFRDTPIRNAEWLMYLDDKGPAAPAVFAHITSALQRRATPADAVRVKRVPLPGGEKRDMLEARYRVFTGYITSYAFGNDLHIGWVYYWHLSLIRYWLLALGNMFNALRGRQTEVHVLARYEPAKTMREALHAAAREGVDLASAAATPMNLAMPANVPVDAVTAVADGNGLFAS